MSSTSDGSTFNTEITADPAAFVKGMQKAADAALSASEDINKHFKHVSETFETVTKYFAGFTAVIAGGGALKKFISDANAWNSEAAKMSKALGVSTQEASVLKVALHGLGIESDTYMAAAQKLSKQVTNNADAFDVMGVKIKDSQGNYRDVSKIMAEVNEKIGAIDNTIERDEAGRQAYGKSWDEIKGILKLNEKEMEEAKETAERLHLVVGPEGAAASKQYSRQMREIGLVTESLEVQFGNALLPVFAKTGAWLSKEGPAAGQVFATVLETIAAVSENLWVGLTDLGDAIGALAAQTAAVLSGDFAAMRAIGKMRDEEAAKNQKKIDDIWANYGKELPPIKIKEEHEGDKGKPGPHYQFKNDEGGKEKQAPSRMPEFERDLAERKVALERQGLMEGQYREMSKADEAKYWSDIAKRAGVSLQDRQNASKKASEVELAQIKEAFQVKVATLQAEEAAYKNNTDEKLRIELQIQSMYQQGTKEYAEAQKKIVEIQRQAAEQQKRIAEMRAQATEQAAQAEIEARMQEARFELDVGAITNSKFLQMQAQFEDQKYQIARDALERRLQLALNDPDKSPEEVERIQEQLQALEQNHQTKLNQIKLDQKKDGMEPFINTMKAGESAISQSLVNMVNHTQSFRQAMASIWKSISQTILSEIARIIARKIAVFATERALAIAGIGADAAKAGSGAAASVASIPYVGPILAVAALASVFGAVSASSSKVPSASAAGGFDIPNAINPVTQLHAREMVLPATLADKVRNMTDDQQPSGAPVININTSHPDDWKRWLRNGGDVAVADAIYRVHRNGWRPS